MASISISRHDTLGCSTASRPIALKKRPSVIGSTWRLPATVMRPRRCRAASKATLAMRGHTDLDHIEAEVERKAPVRGLQHRQCCIRDFRSDIVSREYRNLHQGHPKIIRCHSESIPHILLKSIG